MGHKHHPVLAGVLAAWLALPVNAEVVLTTETMTGTGLPPGQTLPASPPAEEAAPVPFTPKTVTAQKMQAWGTASAATTTTTTTTTRATTKPAIQRTDRLQPRTREVPTIVKPVRKLP